MGNLWLPDLDDWLRDADLEVHEFDGDTPGGWRARSRSSGGYDDIHAVGLHHDASAIGRGWELAARAHFVNHEFAPVGALALNRDGSWTVGAAGATNTQGKGGPYRCSRGTTPLDSANRYWISIEAGNNGLGEPWPQPQQDSYLRGVAAIVRGLAEQGAYDAAARRYRKIVLDPLIDGGVAHFEWTTRKIDPAGPARWANTADRYQRWQMAAWRADVAALLTVPEEDDMDPTKMTLWRPWGYQNIFIITPAGVFHASLPLLKAFGLPTDAAGITARVVEDDHPQTRKSMVAQAGLTEADLVKA